MPRLPIRAQAPKLPLTVGLILSWADEFHKEHGRWPHGNDSFVSRTSSEKWGNIDMALSRGNRGLRGGDTLAKLLLRHRGRPHHNFPPDLTIPQILAWADAHRRRTGQWPGPHDGGIPRTRQTWSAIQSALQRGKRGLPGGTSLARVLAEHRGVRNHLAVPTLTEKQILTWADDHHRRTGQYPKHLDGPILCAPGESWLAMEIALVRGHRGLSGGDSLAKLLARSRGVRNKSAIPVLTVKQIKKWAVAFNGRTGKWPTVTSGQILEAPGETWSGVQSALMSGIRGLPGGDSLARLLERECGRRNIAALPLLELDRMRC